MLKVIDDGVIITLNGTDKNPLFVMSVVLVGCAMAVAVIAMTMSVDVTIGAMAVFAVMIFIFNLYKNRLSTQITITSGNITIKKRHFITAQHSVRLSDNAVISLSDDVLTVADLGRVWRITGCDDVKEIHVAKAVLEGQTPQKQERAIRIL